MPVDFYRCKRPLTWNSVVARVVADVVARKITVEAQRHNVYARLRADRLARWVHVAGEVVEELVVVDVFPVVDVEVVLERFQDRLVERELDDVASRNLEFLR